MSHNEPQLQKPGAWLLNASQLSAFDRVLHLIRSGGADVVLVQAPVTQSLYRSYRNNREFDRFMAQKGNYINFNSELISLDEQDHFYDAQHLNQDGVILFNTELLDRHLADRLRRKRLASDRK